MNSEKCRHVPAHYAAPIILLIAYPLFLPAAQAAIPQSERQALLTLYDDTNGDTWADTSGWKGPPGTECAWYGVTCDPSQSTVTSVDLDNNLLTGLLPTSISALTHLQYFNVGNDGTLGDRHFGNIIHGQIPPLAGLHELQVFVANNQNLTGPIPPLAGLSSLTRLEVPRNRLTGPIPSLSGLTKLAHFDASYNQLTGTLPDLSDLANLSYFRVGQNQLVGTIPELDRFTSLTDVDVSGNRFTGTIPSLTGLDQLQVFFASTNELTGSIPSLSSLVALQDFQIGGNRLTGGVPDLTGLDQLRSFWVSANELSGPVPAAPASLQIKTYSASLCSNQLTPASDPPSEIDLGWNAATGVTPWSQKCAQTPAVTAVAITSNGNPSIVGQWVTFTASVYGGVSPTGTVTFTATQPVHDGQTVLCTDVALIDQVATCTFSDFAGGTSNVVSATYSGDDHNASSTNVAGVDQAVFFDVNQTTSANPAQQGQAVDWVATIGGGAAMTDTVTFFDGKLPICSNVPVVASGDDVVSHCVTTFDRLGDHALSVLDNAAGLGGGSNPMIQSVVASQAFDANQFALTGSWFNAYTSGQGLTIQAYPDFVAPGKALLGGGWFTYDTAGNARWLYLQGAMTSADGSTFDLGVYESSGGNFDAPPVTSAVDYGSATLTFYDCGHATLTYTFLDGRSGTIPYTRLTSSTECSNEVPPVTLGTPPFPETDALRSGNWFSPSTSGQGLVLDVVPSQSTFVMTWYTYAPQSEAQSGEASERWFYIQAAYTPGNVNLAGAPIYAAQGGIFNAPTPIAYTQVGTADITFTSCKAMTLHYTFTQGEFTGLSGTIAEQPVGPAYACP